MDRGVCVDEPLSGCRTVQDTLSRRVCALEIAAAEDQQELISSISKHAISLSGGIFQNASDTAENVVSGQVTVGVVDRFEVVYVDEDGADSGAAGEVFLQHSGDALVQCSPREETRQAVQ